ncbi:CaiB/BaiF CoA transferase family protein [Aerococcus tenax]
MTETRKDLIPEYGPLHGVRILGLGSIVAMPHAGNLLADLGAEFIQIERPGMGDSLRMLAPFSKKTKVSNGWMQDARNRLSITLESNLNNEDAKAVFLDLIKEVDIFMDNMVWLKKLGIDDDEMLEANPKLVICHISGFGQEAFGGEEGVSGRASFDMIGQAYGGFLNLNGEPDGAPMVVKPYLNDYVSALNATYGVLAAYIHAQKTGKGQVVDVAQYEAMARILCDTFVTYTENGEDKERTGNKTTAFQPYGLFFDKNGEYVVVGAFGRNVYNRFLEAVGFDKEYFAYEVAGNGVDAVMSERGQELDQKIKEWCSQRTAKEIEDTLNAHRVPASKVNKASDALNSEHFKARNNFVTYTDQTSGEEVTAFGVVQHMSETPGKVWRGAPAMGQDNELVYGELLGYSEEKIAELKEKGLI